MGGAKIRFLLATTDGEAIKRVTHPVDARSSPEDIVDIVEGHIHDLLRESHSPIRQLASIVAGLPGVTNARAGTVKAAPFLLNWIDVPIQAMLERRLNVPVAIENDVNLAAIGESVSGTAVGYDDFIFLAIGTGVGAGIFLRGEIYHGADWASGEVGYLQVRGAAHLPIDVNSPGSLESVISGPAIERAWKRCSSVLGDHASLSATEIFQLAENGVSAAETLLHKTAAVLSNAIVNISLVFNCPLFVLGGGVGCSPQLHCAVKEKVKQNNLVHPRVEVSALKEDAQLVGAVRLACGMVRTVSHHAVRESGD